MDDFDALLSSQWGSEKWILDGWEKINADDKSLIKKRMEELFQDGLPFEIKHDKILYVYAFALLAQLEVLAIQVPLKFKEKMSTEENKERMHHQLLDEIFHGLVFTKIIYMLCEPYATPPAYNEHVEVLCNFIRNEECPKVAIMLLNLIAEGWIEEAFRCFSKHGIAPKVFDIILTDEHRHVCEADLYSDIGMPDMNVLKEKLAFMEEKLILSFFMQYKYVASTTALLGLEGAAGFTQSINEKHHQQLKKINLKPGAKWSAFMSIVQNSFPRVLEYSQSNYEVEMTPMRQLLMSQWENSSDATMVSQFNINVSDVEFFSKKYPPETLTTLTLQAVSRCLKETDSYRSYLTYKKLFQSKEAYVGIIVSLPGCGDHIGTIIFENCHEMSAIELAQRIRDIVPMMVYCYKKREELEKKYPNLKLTDEKELLDFAYNVYGLPLPGSSLITISNIGFWGYTDAKSPLFKNESMKIVLLEVERKQVWNKEGQVFETQDHLPVSISADHRVFDGNQPIPKLINHYFQQLFQKMQADLKKTTFIKPAFDSKSFIKTAETIVNIHPEIGYKFLSALQTIWPEFLAPEDLMKPIENAKIAANMMEMSMAR